MGPFDAFAQIGMEPRHQILNPDAQPRRAWPQRSIGSCTPRHVDGNRRADAGAASARAQDRRVDADKLTLTAEPAAAQRACEVSGSRSELRSAIEQGNSHERARRHGACPA